MSSRGSSGNINRVEHARTQAARLASNERAGRARERAQAKVAASNRAALKQIEATLTEARHQQESQKTAAQRARDEAPVRTLQEAATKADEAARATNNPALVDLYHQLAGTNRQAAESRSYLLHTGGKFGDKSTDGQARRAAASAQLKASQQQAKDITAQIKATTGPTPRTSAAQLKSYQAEYTRMAAQFVKDTTGENRRATFRNADAVGTRVYQDVLRAAQRSEFAAMDKRDAATTPKERASAGRAMAAARRLQGQADQLWNTLATLKEASRNNPETTQRWLTAYKAG
jgi:hypothetical protein